MDNDARLLLDDVIACCQRDGLDARLVNMLAGAQATDLNEDALTIEAPSRFAYSYLVKQRAAIERYLEEIAFAPLALMVTAPQAPAAARSAAEAAEQAGSPSTPAAAAPGTASVAAEAAAAAEASYTAPAAPSPAIDPVPPQFHGGPALARADEGDRRVSINNTLSPEQFKSMMAAMKQGGNTAPAPRMPEAAAPTIEEQQHPAASSGISAKYTFENFVLGDENRHAYQSAARFAAFADEPGQCTSLFIYGNSGLGKTHLLFAIQNYIATEKPWMRVKYANSQAYIDDYMRDLGAQRGPGEPIMREYRNADVLIIDDIQNIIGRQASIEFFFQLVDEFIRESKKIVIASDRAPKKLGMDERLTSRFNSGMLCLVSEPTFETKYRILKYYYEHTLRAERPVSRDGAGASILDGITLEEGTLTDDHLRHMAEISGNNIRELESFCERCSGLSYEKERAGSELTAADIDAVADEYFDTARKVVKPATIQAVVEEFYHVSHADLIGRKQTKDIAFPRHVAIFLIHQMCDLSLPAIGSLFGRNHATVVHSLNVIEKKRGEEAAFSEQLQQLSNIVLIKS